MEKIKIPLALCATCLLLVFFGLQFTYISAQNENQNTDQIAVRPNDPINLQRSIESTEISYVSNDLKHSYLIEEATNDESSNYATVARFFNSLDTYSNLSGQVDQSTVADVNGDGLLDVILINSSSFNGYQRYMPQMEDGTLGLPMWLPVDVEINEPKHVAVGQFNEDERLDLVFVGYEATTEGYEAYMTFLLPDDSGNSNAKRIKVPWSPEFLDVLDINGDSIDDLLFDLQYAYISINDGSFAYKEFANPIYPANVEQEHHAAADINGDGSEELLRIVDTSNAQTDPVPPFFQIHNFVDDQITSTNSISYFLPAGAKDIEIIDVDEDGTRDIIYASGESLVVLRQIGNLSFIVEEFYQLPEIEFCFHSIDAIEVGDINGDSFDDIVAVYNHCFGNFDNKNLLVFLGDVRGLSNTPIELYDLKVSGDESNVILADISNDGFPDLVSPEGVHRNNKLFEQVYLPLQYNRFINFRPFYDDFSDPNSGWPIINNQYAQIGYESGKYLMWNKTDTVYSLSVLNHLSLNYELSFEVSRADTIEGGFGVVTEVSEDLSSFKGFIIFPDYHTLLIVQPNPDGSLAVVDRIVYRGDNFEVPFDYTYKISLERLDEPNSNGLVLRVDDGNVDSDGNPQVLYHNVAANGDEHYVGFISVPLDYNFKAYFDNFVLEPK